MGNIRRVMVRVATGDLEGAGTTGEVYLGLAGMEFKMNSTASGDYEAGSDRTYVLGEHAGVHQTSAEEARFDFAFADRNDPRITTMERAARHPVYVRMHPMGEGHDWLPRVVGVAVEGDDDSHQKYHWEADPGRWLGCEYGLTVHLD